jgi:hypothetical protein
MDRKLVKHTADELSGWWIVVVYSGCQNHIVIDYRLLYVGLVFFSNKHTNEYKEQIRKKN